MSNEELLKPRHMRVSDATMYSISDNGQVTNTKTGRVLKPCTNNRGYLYVELRSNGEQIRRYIHRLVAQSFVDGYKLGLVVNHKDSNKLNNHYSNLEWVTNQQNLLHAHKNGFGKNGDNHYMSKLFCKDPFQIRFLKTNYNLSNRELAYLYEVSETLISNLIKGVNYKNDVSAPNLTTSRVMVKIAYPKSPFKVGDIFYADKGTKLNEIASKYPGVFSFIEWWENRKVEDMPKYVKHVTYTTGILSVYKVDGFETNQFREFIALSQDSETGKVFLKNAEALPSTEAEYLSQQETNKQK